MIQAPLGLYRIDMKYIRNLHNIDDRVLSVSPRLRKMSGLFLGYLLFVMNISIVFHYLNQRKSIKK